MKSSSRRVVFKHFGGDDGRDSVGTLNDFGARSYVGYADELSEPKLMALFAIFAEGGDCHDGLGSLCGCCGDLALVFTAPCPSVQDCTEAAVIV